MFGKKNVFDILNIPSHLPAPPREGLFCALWDVTADAVWCRRYCYIYCDTICKLFALLCVSIWYYDFTTNGEGEHARHTSRKVAISPERRKPQQVPSTASRKPTGAGKQATAGNGVI